MTLCDKFEYIPDFEYTVNDKIVTIKTPFIKGFNVATLIPQFANIIHEENNSLIIHGCSFLVPEFCCCYFQTFYLPMETVQH